MKKISKISLIGLTFAASVNLLAAQSFEDDMIFADDQIQLPDVTTVVSGDTLTAGKSSVPELDFKLPDAGSTQIPLPQMPTAQTSEVQDTDDEIVAAGGSKEMYVEGLIGAGYPGFFRGDFTVYKNSGDSPFNTRFFHESENGYSRNKAANGFFDSTTLLSGEKQINLKYTTFNFGAEYSTASNGFQGLSDSFYDTTQQTLSTKDSVSWNLPKGFGIALEAEGQWYNRYSGLIPGADQLYTPQDAEGSVLFLTPEAKFNWENDMLHFGIDMKYTYEDLISSVDSSARKTNVHRGLFKFDSLFRNDVVTVEGDVSALIGNQLNDHKILVPFNLGVTVQWPMAGNYGTVFAAGGMSSTLNRYSELERKFRFASLNELPGESSDWYGQLKTSLPVTSAIKLEANVDFKTTAFGNGIWEPQYSSASTAWGLYSFLPKNRTELNSMVAVSFLYKVFTFTLDCYNYLIYVPADQSPCSLKLAVGVQDPKGIFGGGITCAESLGQNVDFIPNVGATFFYRVNDSFKFSIEVNDFVKLCTGGTRSYNGSKYISRAENISFFAKFFF